MPRIAFTFLFAGIAACAQAAEPAIRGAGATFPQPVYAEWAAAYREAGGDDIRYDAVGSGVGLARIAARQVDFGATDVPLAVAELQRAGVMQFPVLIGGVVPVVNITGIASGQLRLSGEVLAGIYLGTIGKWSAPAIAALNPGLHLPDVNITVVHRLDASGSTWLWSEYLARSSARWRAQLGVGTEIAWPDDAASVGGLGNDGAASCVQRTRNSIGYVEYAYAVAHRLKTAALRNRDGVFVKPERASFEAAAASLRWADPGDLVQVIVDAPGAASWPVTGASYILLPIVAEQPARSTAVMKFFDWALRHGQPAAIGLDYVPLPPAAADRVGRAWRDQVRDAAGAAVWGTAALH
jgi:phosphate transport system substrate-binding protein